jgi:hypothetical protein
MTSGEAVMTLVRSLRTPAAALLAGTPGEIEDAIRAGRKLAGRD